MPNEIKYTSTYADCKPRMKDYLFCKDLYYPRRNLDHRVPLKKLYTFTGFYFSFVLSIDNTLPNLSLGLLMFER